MKERVVIPGFRNKLLAFAVRTVLRNTATRIAGRMNERA